MEVISNNDGLLTDLEVLEILEEKRSTREKDSRGSIPREGAVPCDFRQRDLIERCVVDYLSMTQRNVNSKQARKFFSEIESLCMKSAEENGLAGVDFSFEELMQICNHRPLSELDMSLLIQDCHLRCSVAQVEIIINLVKSCFEIED